MTTLSHRLGQFLRGLALVTLATSAVAAFAQTEPQAGRDYTVVSPAQATTDPKRIVVTEFFSYECPHCNAFSPSVMSWAAKLPKDVLFERVAVSVGHTVWVKPAQLFYTLQAMGNLDQFDAAVFKAIHVDRAPLTEDAGIIEWATKQGIDRDKFIAAYNSFSVKSFQLRGDALAKANRLPSVPTLVIDGKYMLPITDNGNFPAQLAVAQKLIDKARADKGSPSQ